MILSYMYMHVFEKNKKEHILGIYSIVYNYNYAVRIILYMTASH